MAERLEVPIIGELPVCSDVSASGDKGAPYMISKPDLDENAGQAWRDTMMGVADHVRKSFGL